MNEETQEPGLPGTEAGVNWRQTLVVPFSDDPETLAQALLDRVMAERNLNPLAQKRTAFWFYRKYGK